jgi:hypothetical protein
VFRMKYKDFSHLTIIKIKSCIAAAGVFRHAIGIHEAWHMYAMRYILMNCIKIWCVFTSSRTVCNVYHLPTFTANAQR